MIRKFFFLLLLLSDLNTFAAQIEPDCSNTPLLFKSACRRLHQVWQDGKNELYLPAYAWHNRLSYSQEKINSFNENPWGTGLGKSFYDEKGDWHGLYAFAFLDSHKNVEPVVGYAFLKVLHLNDETSMGAGYALLVTARPDIFHNIPFPGALPWVSVSYHKASFAATYIPGSQGAGNVFFLILKYML
jgi:palmitoyl transferase